MRQISHWIVHSVSASWLFPLGCILLSYLIVSSSIAIGAMELRLTQHKVNVLWCNCVWEDSDTHSWIKSPRMIEDTWSPSLSNRVFSKKVLCGLYILIVNYKIIILYCLIKGRYERTFPWSHLTKSKYRFKLSDSWSFILCQLSLNLHLPEK